MTTPNPTPEPTPEQIASVKKCEAAYNRICAALDQSGLTYGEFIITMGAVITAMAGVCDTITVHELLQAINEHAIAASDSLKRVSPGKASPILEVKFDEPKPENKP